MRFKQLLRKATYIFIGLILFFTFFSKTINNLNTPLVRTAGPEKGYLLKTISGNGRVVPENYSRIYLPDALIVEKILVRTGEFVEEGRPLLKLNREMVNDLREREFTEYYKTQLEIKSKKEELRPYDCSSNIDDLKRRMLIAAENMEAKTELYSSGYLSKKDLEEAEVLLDEAESAYRAAERSTALAIREEETRIRNVERRIAVLELEIDGIERNIEALNNLKDSQVLLSPVSGRVADIQCSEGNLYRKETPLLSIVNGGGYIFTAETDRSFAEDIEPGQAATIFLNRDREFTGTLLSAYPGADGQRLQLEFSMEAGDLTGNESGFFVLRKRSPYYDCIIPRKALRGTGNRRFIYIVEKQEGALSTSYLLRKCDVKLLASGDSRAAVYGEVSENDQIAYGEDRRVLDDGVKVRTE